MSADDALERGRRLVAGAEQALDRLQPLRFDIARTEDERDAVLRMRYECAVEQGWIRPDELPDGREHDADDDRATFVLCRDGDVLAGSLRIVPPSPSRLLPTEQAFGLRARPAGRVAEVGRLVVAPSARPGRSHRIIGGLCARGWLAVFACGCDRALSSATPELIELYRGLGLRVTVLGPARTHWGARRAPIVLDGDERSLSFLTDDVDERTSNAQVHTRARSLSEQRGAAVNSVGLTRSRRPPQGPSGCGSGHA